MEELEDIDALINDVPEKREYGETAAQIKVKTFANNFANIGNIGEERRTTQAKVRKTILRRDGGETNGHVCPPSPSPSPSPSPPRSTSTGQKPAKRSSTGGNRAISGSQTKRRKASMSEEQTSQKGNGFDKDPNNGWLEGEKTKEAFQKSCLIFPNDIELNPKERVDVTFEVEPLKDVGIGVEVKSCFSFNNDRSLLSALEQKQLAKHCQIDAQPSQTVCGGRVTASFTNSQDRGILRLDKGTKIGDCWFQLPTFGKIESLTPMLEPRVEALRVNTGSIDSAAACSTPAPLFRETQAGAAAVTQADAEAQAVVVGETKTKTTEGFRADTSLLGNEPDGIKPVKTGCDSSLTIGTSSTFLAADTSVNNDFATAWRSREGSANMADCGAAGMKPGKFLAEDLLDSKSSLTALHLTHDQNLHSKEETEDKKFEIKSEDLKDMKCPDLFLENIRSGMTALEYSDPEICGFVDLYFAWCHSQEKTPTSEEGDELLQQVSMLDVSLGELTKVLEDNWSLPTEREESEWKEIFGQKFSLIQSEMITEFPKILKILLLDFKTTLNTKKPDPDADLVSKNVIFNELPVDKAVIKEAVMMNAEKQLQQLRKKNEELVAKNEKMTILMAAKEQIPHRSKPLEKNDQRSSAASFFQDLLRPADSNAKYKDEFELKGAVGRVEDFLPKKHIFKVFCEDDEDLDILLASKSAEMFLGKRIQFNAKPLRDRHHKVFLNERTKERTFRVTQIYSSKLNDIDSERDLLSRLKREPSEGSSSLVSSSTDVVHRIKEKNEESAKEDFRNGRDVDVKWKVRRMPKDCSHFTIPRFCKFKQCDGKCGDQHEFSSLQHKILMEDVGSYCFRFPKFTCHKVKCGFPHYSWLSLCRILTDGLKRRKDECMNEGPCSQSGCRQLSETLLKSLKLCRPPCNDDRRCQLAHSLPSHLKLPDHCTAFDSCTAPDCTSPHIPFSNINEIFIQKRSALQMFCEQCYTERMLKTEQERHGEGAPEVSFLGFSPTSNQDLNEEESWKAGSSREGLSQKRRRSSSRSESDRFPKQSIFSRLGAVPNDIESRSSPVDDKTDLKSEKCDDDDRTKYDFAKNLKELEDEICKMLEERESIPLGQIPPTYNQVYKRQLVLADYGFQRGQLPTLVAAMDERLEITGEDKHRVVSLRRRPKIVKFSRSTFENNAKKMLQVQGTVKLNNLMAVYSRMFGNQHTLESYGFQSVEDIVKAGEQMFKVIDISDEKVVKLRIGRKYKDRPQVKEDIAAIRQVGKSNEQRLVYMQRRAMKRSYESEESFKAKRLEERREIERRVEARRGLKREVDAKKREEKDEIGERRKQRKSGEHKDEKRKRQEREESRDKRSSRDSRSQCGRSSREEDDLIEDIVGDPDDQGELLQIMEQAHMEQ